MLGSALYRHQKREEALAVSGTGIFLQSLVEWEMLSLSFG